MTTATRGIRCSCPIGWGGLICATPECHGYCRNGGTCFIAEQRAICSCSETWMGDRCQFPRSAVQVSFAEKRAGTTAEVLIVVFPVMLIILLTIAVLYMVVVRRNGVSRQFTHSRMQENRTDADMDEFHNPAFMAGEEEDATAIIINESTNFTNPMYESVYNDTVTCLPDTGTTPLTQNPEQFVLLERRQIDESNSHIGV